LKVLDQSAARTFCTNYMGLFEQALSHQMLSQKLRELETSLRPIIRVRSFPQKRWWQVKLNGEIFYELRWSRPFRIIRCNLEPPNDDVWKSRWMQVLQWYLPWP